MCTKLGNFYVSLKHTTVNPLAFKENLKLLISAKIILPRDQKMASVRKLNRFEWNVYLKFYLLEIATKYSSFLSIPGA